MMSIPPGVTRRFCASTSPDRNRSLRSSSANCAPPTTCWMCRNAAVSGIQPSGVDCSDPGWDCVLGLGALAMGCIRGSGSAGRDFARLARPTSLAHLAPQRDDVVARRGASKSMYARHIWGHLSDGWRAPILDPPGASLRPMYGSIVAVRKSFGVSRKGVLGSSQSRWHRRGPDASEALRPVRIHRRFLPCATAPDERQQFGRLGRSNPLGCYVIGLGHWASLVLG